LIEAQEVNGVISIMKVNRSHPDYRAFVVQKQQPNNDKMTTPLSTSLPFSILELFKPPSGFQPLFVQVGETKKMYYERSEIQSILWKYVKQENLTPNEGGNHDKIFVNQFLLSTLFHNSNKQLLTSDSQGNHLLHKKDLPNLVIQHMQRYYQVNRGTISELRKGSIGEISIVVEDRQGGRKHITKVTGLENFAIDPSEISSKLPHLFAASTTIHPTPQTQNSLHPQMEVAIQGNVGVKIADHLVNVYAIPKKYIQILDKSKKKGKK